MYEFQDTNIYTKKIDINKEMLKIDENYFYKIKTMDDESIMIVLKEDVRNIHNINDLSNISDTTIEYILNKDYWFYVELLNKDVFINETITLDSLEQAIEYGDLAFVKYVVINKDLQKKSLIHLINKLVEKEFDIGPFLSIHKLSELELQEHIIFKF